MFKGTLAVVIVPNSKTYATNKQKHQKYDSIFLLEPLSLDACRQAVHEKMTYKENTMTITDAVKKILKHKSKPMTVTEIHDAIVAGSLFEFKSKSAASIVRSQIRRHCEGVRTQNVSPKKLFRQVGSDRYELVENP